MALTQKERQQLMGLLIVVALAAGFGYWNYLWKPRQQTVSQLKTEIDSLNAKVDSAKAELARGTLEDLQQRIAAYEGSLGLMRRLVPADNEVPSLIDNIAARAALRDVNIRNFDPQPPEPAGMFQIYRYRLVVLGHYDEIGEFIADVASLPRIMVPYQVELTPVGQVVAQAQRDTTGSLLEAEFQIRTFVKTPGATPEAGGVGGDR